MSALWHCKVRYMMAKTNSRSRRYSQDDVFGEEKCGGLRPGELSVRDGTDSRAGIILDSLMLQILLLLLLEGLLMVAEVRHLVLLKSRVASRAGGGFQCGVTTGVGRGLRCC